MSQWITEYRVRCIAERLAPKITPIIEARMSPIVERAIMEALPNLLMAEFREFLPDLTAQSNRSDIRLRNETLRAMYNGKNILALSKQFNLSQRQIFRILRF